MLMKLLATIRKYWRYPCSPRPIRYLLVLTLAGLPGLVGGDAARIEFHAGRGRGVCARPGG